MNKTTEAAIGEVAHALLAQIDPYPTTYHRDGSVTLWNIYTQALERYEASAVSERILASMNRIERERIERMARKPAEGDR